MISQKYTKNNRNRNNEDKKVAFHYVLKKLIMERLWKGYIKIKTYYLKIKTHIKKLKHIIKRIKRHKNDQEEKRHTKDLSAVINVNIFKVIKVLRDARGGGTIKIYKITSK